MVHAILGGAIYCIPEKQADKLRELQDQVDLSKGDAAIDAAIDEYNRFVIKTMTDKTPIAEEYSCFPYWKRGSTDKNAGKDGLPY